MSPNPRGRIRFSDDDPDRGMRNLLYLLLGLVVVQLVILIGLWVDRPDPDEIAHTAAVIATEQLTGRERPAAETATPATREEPATEPTKTAGAQAEPVKVQVLNGCGVNGIAGRTRDWLVRRGYDVRDVGNADRQNNAKSRIIDHGGDIRTAREFAELLGINPSEIVRTSEKPSLKVDLTLILGKDYKNLAIAR